ncbi:MAG TPA: heme exporter protein CcmD [Burkholderiaceae bacterium]|jgi:heme exporter protein D|nr:heme exporter protein CcmD [Burkholderiaceae bacterium]HRZ01281.1 heme exporter protein CcmD [Burkholderiaceae bacterium]
MQWGSWENFWAMGGYGFYVWGAYGMTVAVLAAEFVLLRTRRARAKSEIARELRTRIQAESKR